MDIAHSNMLLSKKDKVYQQLSARAIHNIKILSHVNTDIFKATLYD